MVNIPPEIQIKSTIQSGSVYYFVKDTFDVNYPHYFVVINNKPLEDTILFLVCSSSQIEKVKARRKNLPQTIVEINAAEYCGFSKDSIIDCNRVFKHTINELIDKLEKGELIQKPHIEESIVKRLRRAVVYSPLVERCIKETLKSSR